MAPGVTLLVSLQREAGGFDEGGRITSELAAVSQPLLEALEAALPGDDLRVGGEPVFEEGKLSPGRSTRHSSERVLPGSGMVHSVNVDSAPALVAEWDVLAIEADVLDTHAAGFDPLCGELAGVAAGSTAITTSTSAGRRARFSPDPKPISTIRPDET